MENNNCITWDHGGLRSGGRPSKVKKIIEMELGEFFELGKNGGTFNGTARALKVWANGKGVEVSWPTARRVIRSLIEDGRIQVEKAVIKGRGSKLTPAAAPSST